MLWAVSTVCLLSACLLCAKRVLVVCLCLLAARLADLAQEDYDGAEPAASSIALASLWRFAGLGGGEVGASGASGGAARQQLGCPCQQYRTIRRTVALPTLQQITLSNCDQPLLSYSPACRRLRGGWVLRAARQPSSVASCQQCTTSQMAMPPLLPAFGLATLLQNFTCKAPAKNPARVRAALAEPRSSGPTPTPVAFKFPPPAGSGR